MLAPLLVFLVFAQPEVARLERNFSMMGTEVDVWVEAADRPAAIRLSESAVRALELAEARLSTWVNESELSKLNFYPAGQPMELSSSLAADLAAARQCSLDTGAAFDPTVGSVVEVWGLRERSRRPTELELRRALSVTGIELLELSANAARRRVEGLRLDEGAWGKGAALDDALAVVARIAPEARVTIDLGGQVAMSASSPPRIVELADPRDRGRGVLAVEIVAGSMATSGNSEHGIVVDGIRYGHILDPRTGWPAADFGSLSVVAPTAFRADCLSTGLYVMGPRAAFAWAASHRGVEVITLEVEADGLVARLTPGMEQKVRALVPELRVEVMGRPTEPAEKATETPSTWQSRVSAAVNPRER